MHLGWEAIRKDRFPLTPLALFEGLVRNTQFILASWNGDATRREARMQAPIEEDDDGKPGEAHESCENNEQKKANPSGGP